MTLPDNSQSPAPPEQPAGAQSPGAQPPAAQQPAAAPPTGTQGPPVPRRAVRRSRLGGVWVAATLFAVVLLLLLVFILENSHQVDIAYFGAHGHLPLGVALLLAAVLGILLVVIPGAGRIIQLRRTARRHHKAAKAAASQQPQPVQPPQQVQPGQPSDPAQPPPADQSAAQSPGGYRPGA
jgi:uncharacterized integral membrane protein